jgi:hypothetical protein
MALSKTFRSTAVWPLSASSGNMQTGGFALVVVVHAVFALSRKPTLRMPGK